MKRLPESEEIFHQAILSEPTLVEAYYDLGTLLLEQNRREEAIKCYRLALSIQPDFALANGNLAKILAEEGKLAEAIRHYETAVRASPETAELHYNLAVAYRSVGQLNEAIGQLRTAIDLKPGLADGYLELGRTLAVNHQYGEAIQTFRRGLEVEPRHMVMGNEMAWLMATVPDANLRNAPQAIQIGERLAELTNRKEPKPLDTLAAAYAEAGRFDEAVRTAKEALTLATAQNSTTLAAEIEAQLKSYQQGKPYRLSLDN
jgi:tetratricopeptide (TPR) repeat protein